jgi:hypothetical protein
VAQQHVELFVQVSRLSKCISNAVAKAMEIHALVELHANVAKIFIEKRRRRSRPKAARDPDFIEDGEPMTEATALDRVAANLLNGKISGTTYIR